MLELLIAVLKSAVTNPLGYWGDVREQMFDTLKLCWLPMIISCTAFGFGAPGLQGGNIFLLFGIPERLGSFFLMASVREFAPWINAMVVAGVMGTAITADLGARIVQLTERGRRLIERAFQGHAINMEESMAVLRSSERTELVRLLKKVGMWEAARLDDKNRQE